jgi:PST family polysaccharide transporter
MINPFSWLLLALGRVGRSLKIALVIAPLVITGYALGLPYGPRGVALGYSAAMILWIVPHIVWCVRDTAISVADIFRVLSRPLLSGIVAAVLSFALQFYCGHFFSPLLRLALGGLVFAIIYFAMLLYVMGQKAFYLDLIRGLKRRSSVEPTNLVPA